MPEIREMAILCKKVSSNFSSQAFGHPFNHIYVISCNTCSLIIFASIFECVSSFKHFFGGETSFPLLFFGWWKHNDVKTSPTPSPRSRKRSASEICIGKGCSAPVPPVPPGSFFVDRKLDEVEKKFVSHPCWAPVELGR